MTSPLRSAILAGALVSLAGAAPAQTGTPASEIRSMGNCAGCVLRDSDHSGERLTGLDLAGAELDGVRFDGAAMMIAVFDGARLEDVTFEGANLRGATFVGARLVNVSFRDADLRGAVFEGAVLERTDLEAAHLCKTQLPDDAMGDSDCD